ncbi:hydrogenase-1 operon protein HyaE [Paucibacter oligotrophus]|uniref:Hydrogenase-1 operon protein HyaE n=1 Tax=Roseateles oligotrophus TaxID=1769250 RepID=A0A840LCF0_9BURK|nr:hydrogenase [Roseateles oligotrophus]MBB4843749.1 hydrogenase-1 operon protein HyaE [Roseateles oligotrophus]
MKPNPLDSEGSEARLNLPVQAPQARVPESLIARLVSQHGASWVDGDSIQAWAEQGGDRVVLFAGDPVQFPEGQDVAVVLPELRRALGGRFEMAVVPRELEQDLARRYGSQRWPSLLFLRDGQYVATLSGMHDWDVFLNEVGRVLSLPVSRAPTIGIPLVSANAGSACH